MVPEHERFGDVADRRPVPTRVTADREHQLMLGGRDADGLCLRLAPVQKPPDAVRNSRSRR